MAEEPPDFIQNVPAEWRRRWGVSLGNQFEGKEKSRTPFSRDSACGERSRTAGSLTTEY